MTMVSAGEIPAFMRCSIATLETTPLGRWIWKLRSVQLGDVDLPQFLLLIRKIINAATYPPLADTWVRGDEGLAWGTFGA